jgi:structure-specific recognition protein 1
MAILPYLLLFADGNLVFSVQNKEMFEIPLNEVTNTSLTAKHEVMIELGGPDGESGSRDRSRKGDQLVEMRFYVPGQANQEGGEGEEESNANVSRQGDEFEFVIITVNC